MLCWKILTKSLQGWNSTKWSEHSWTTTVDKLELHSNNLLQKRWRGPRSNQCEDLILTYKQLNWPGKSCPLCILKWALAVVHNWREVQKKHQNFVSSTLPHPPPRKIIQYQIPRMPSMVISVQGWSSAHMAGSVLFDLSF
jgi:hypothetical protein